MQKVYLRKPKSTADFINQQQDKILHFSLQDSLPSGCILALNSIFGTLSYLSCDQMGIPRLQRQEQFTNTEMCVLMPLLELFPYYCPYEVLYASFYNGGKTDEANIEQARAHLEEAMDAGSWDQEMRPIRCALSRTRLKMRSFNIDISSILATGYILLVNSDPEDEELYEAPRKVAGRR